MSRKHSAKPADPAPDVPTEQLAAPVDSGADAKPARNAPRRVVAVLPPLMMPSRIMLPMCWRLRRAGCDPRLFAYPSWRRDIPDNALRLAEWLRGLKQTEVDVVCFSLGSVLIRWAANHCEIPALRRVVMLGPPSQGALLADKLSRKIGPGFPMFWGRCAMQLRRGPNGLAARAGALPSETQLGVIAGGTGKGRGFNRWIPGDNDLTVGVEETVVPGMTDFALVRSTHSGLVLLARPAQLTVRFLETGSFRARKPAHHDAEEPQDAH